MVARPGDPCKILEGSKNKAGYWQRPWRRFKRHFDFRITLQRKKGEGRSFWSVAAPPGRGGESEKTKVYLERAAAPVQGNEQKRGNTHTDKRGTVKKQTNEQKKRNRDEKAHRKNR